jgi:rod shape-determining protein MreD
MILVPLCAALLQGTVAPLAAVAEARPLLPVLVAASWAVACGAREAVWWAFLGGLGADLLSGGPLGAFALASLLPVAVLGARDSALTRATPVVAGALLVGATAAAVALIYLGILVVTAQPIASVPLAAGTALASGVYTGALALGVYPLARVVRRVTEKQGALGVW